jgi:exosortase D (VPLPA-CTERM-specific)
VAVVFLGGLALFLGQIGTVYTLVQYAFVITVYGLILSFLGRPAFKLVAVPLLILFFMVPLPNFLLFNLSSSLQLISSQLGVAFMRLFDISVFLEGNVIDLGGYKLEVAEACSGLRYLFPLMTLGFLMSYFYKGAWWKRIVLFLSSIPITVLMNSLRVGAIGVAVEHWGIEMAEGFLHEFQGWMVFMISMLIMFGEIIVLTRIGHESAAWRQLFGVEFPAPSPAGVASRKRSVPTPFIAAALILVCLVVVTVAVPRPSEIVPQRTSLTQYPMQIEEWKGHRETLEAVYTDQLQLDDYLLADYLAGPDAIVNLYVSYYNSQRKGEAVHSPRACLPGGGWQMQQFDQRTIPGATINGQPLRVNRALIQQNDQREVVYYWFQQRGRVITNEFAVKWFIFWDALTRHRTDGAMIRVITPLKIGSEPTEADARLREFVTRIAPTLDRYVPN